MTARAPSKAELKKRFKRQLPRGAVVHVVFLDEAIKPLTVKVLSGMPSAFRAERSFIRNKIKELAENEFPHSLSYQHKDGEFFVFSVDPDAFTDVYSATNPFAQFARKQLLPSLFFNLKSALSKEEVQAWMLNHEAGHAVFNALLGALHTFKEKDYTQKSCVTLKERYGITLKKPEYFPHFVESVMDLYACIETANEYGMRPAKMLRWAADFRAVTVFHDMARELRRPGDLEELGMGAMFIGPSHAYYRHFTSPFLDAAVMRIGSLQARARAIGLMPACLAFAKDHYRPGAIHNLPMDFVRLPCAARNLDPLTQFRACAKVSVKNRAYPFVRRYLAATIRFMRPGLIEPAPELDGLMRQIKQRSNGRFLKAAP